MARKKPADLVHINLRLREDLRQQLEDAAKQRGVTLSTEIRMRLDDSFEREPTRKLEDICNDLDSVHRHLLAERLGLENFTRDLDGTCRDLTNTRRSLENACHDMETAWNRHAARLTRNEIEHDLITAIERGDNLKKIKELAHVWRIHADEIEPLYRPKTKKGDE
jgi:hypothetical protein